MKLQGTSLDALRHDASRMLNGLRIVAHHEAQWCPAPRLYAAQAFDVRRSAHDDPAWAPFSTASLTLPFASLIRDGDRAALALAFDRTSLANVDHVLRRSHEVLTSLTTTAHAEHTPRWVASSDRASWHTLVARALAYFGEQRAEKLVAVRREVLIADSRWNADAVCDALVRAAQQGTVCFAFEQGDACFVGATPERLVSLHSGEVAVDALAGTVPRDPDEAHDRRRADGLLRASKERREHALVVQGIRAALAPLCAAIDAPEAPRVRTLRHVHHLYTPVRVKLSAPRHVLSLVAALHPTPALGGSPRDVALDWIATHEEAPRGWFAGPVGWCDATGDGEFFVAIRSAVLRDTRAWVYAGAGLVAGSQADHEWNETEAKMAPMRAALRGEP
jgi:isochorismate synthase